MGYFTVGEDVIDRTGRTTGTVNSQYIGYMQINVEPKDAEIFVYETTDGTFTTSGALRQSGVGSVKFGIKNTNEFFKIKIPALTADFQGIVSNIKGIPDTVKTFILPWNPVVAERNLTEFLKNVSDNGNFNENYVWQGEIDANGYINKSKGIWTYKTAFERANAYACKVALIKNSNGFNARVWARRKANESLVPAYNPFWGDYATQLWWFDPWALFQKNRQILGDKYITWEIDVTDNNKSLNQYDLTLYNEILKSNAKNIAGIKDGTLPFSHVRTYQRWDKEKNGTFVKAVGKYFGTQTNGVVVLHEFEFFDSRVNPIPYLTDPGTFLLKVVEKGVDEGFEFLADILDKACALVQSGAGATLLTYAVPSGGQVTETANAICGKKQQPQLPVATTNLNLYLALGGVAILGIFLLGSKK